MFYKIDGCNERGTAPAGVHWQLGLFQLLAQYRSMLKPGQQRLVAEERAFMRVSIVPNSPELQQRSHPSG